MTTQLPAFTDSVPIDPLTVAANYFSLDCLQTSFKLLREQHPCLALAVQNCIADARLEQTHSHQDKQVALALELTLVSNIVAALTSIAETAARDPAQNKTTLVNIHQTLLDWLLYAQSFLLEPSPVNP